MSTAVATPEDVARVYQLILGRDPSPADRHEARAGGAITRLVSAFCRSPEFDARARMAVANGSLPHGEALPPSESLRAWACGRLPLGQSTSAAVLEAPNWATLYLALFTDDRVRLAAETVCPSTSAAAVMEPLSTMAIKTCISSSVVFIFAFISKVFRRYRTFFASIRRAH